MLFFFCLLFAFYRSEGGPGGRPRQPARLVAIGLHHLLRRSVDSQYRCGERSDAHYGGCCPCRLVSYWGNLGQLSCWPAWSRPGLLIRCSLGIGRDRTNRPRRKRASGRIFLELLPLNLPEMAGDLSLSMDQPGAAIADLARWGEELTTSSLNAPVR